MLVFVLILELNKGPIAKGSMQPVRFVVVNGRICASVKNVIFVVVVEFGV